MTLRLFPTLAILVLAGLLWVVPSIGTQGIGTLGQQFSHPDRALVDNDNVTDLRAADVAVESELAVRPIDAPRR